MSGLYLLSSSITIAQSGDPPNLKDCSSCRREQLEWSLDLPNQIHTKLLLEKLNWMSVMDRVEYRHVIMVHKFRNRTAQEYIRQMFNFLVDVNQRNTRYVDNLNLYLPTWNQLKTIKKSPPWDNVAVTIPTPSNSKVFILSLVKYLQ